MQHENKTSHEHSIENATYVSSYNTQLINELIYWGGYGLL